MTAMTNAEAATSTDAQPLASRTAFCPDVVSIDDPSVILFDFMDINYQRAIQNCPAVGAVRWAKNASLTALSYDYYNTSTYKTAILLYNGYVSESRIPAGATINIPDLSGLKAQLQSSNKGTVTKV